MDGFLARVAPTKNADGRDQYKTGFNEELASIHPIHRSIFQVRIGEEAVEKKGGSGKINCEVEGLPEMAAQSKPHILSNHNERQKINSHCANGVFERLAWRMNRIDQVRQAEPWVLVQEQDRRMQKRHRECDVAGPVVQAKVVEPAMRPGAVRAIPKRHEHTQKHIHGTAPTATRPT